MTWKLSRRNKNDPKWWEKRQADIKLVETDSKLVQNDLKLVLNDISSLCDFCKHKHPSCVGLISHYMHSVSPPSCDSTAQCVVAVWDWSCDVCFHERQFGRTLFLWWFRMAGLDCWLGVKVDEPSETVPAAVWRLSGASGRLPANSEWANRWS